jgi:ferredoxin
MPRVTFVPLGKVREIKAGATILAAAKRCDVSIGQSCDGDGICGWCRVQVVEGIEHLAPPTLLEQQLIRDKAFSPGERAACLAKVTGDISVTTTYW